jgi:hypothetical protein
MIVKLPLEFGADTTTAVCPAEPSMSPPSLKLMTSPGCGRLDGPGFPTAIDG